MIRPHLPEMSRAEKIGMIGSAVLHVTLVAWAAFGGLWFRAKPSEPIELAEVAVMSEADFAAMMAAAPKASDTPPAALTEPLAPQAPAETAEPEAQPEPPAPEEPAPEQAAPEQPAPGQAETLPDLSDLTPPTPAEVTEVPPEMMQPVEVPQETASPEMSPRPKPKPIARVAPKPAEAPEPDAKVSDTAEAQTKPDEAAKPEEVVEKKDEAAPPEATTEIVTEATETEDKPETSAPATSARPRSKPAKPAAPAPTETKTAESKPDAPKPATPSKPAAAASSDAVNDALAEALAEPAPAKTGSGGNGSLASGPPVTAGEKEALIVDVKACWNVGALSSEALRTTVVIGLSMKPDGKPDNTSIHRISYSGGSEAAAAQAYEAGRRAIIRCGSDGFPLPAEKYDHWREIEITFDPNNMRMK